MANQQTAADYNLARKSGRKYFAEHAGKDGDTGYLTVLSDNISNEQLMGEISLGLHEIRLSDIRGTYTAGRSNAFAGNFMPLLEDGTEFAMKWQSLLQSAKEEGIREPIKAYEYLGYYYALEGNKRVSVSHYLGGYSLYANLYRLVPKRNERSDEISCYYEILDYDNRGFWFSGMHFTKRGAFTELIAWARKYAKTVPQLDGQEPHEWLPSLFRDFTRHYELAGYNELGLSEADAYHEYVKVYGFGYGIDYSGMEKQIKACGSQFEKLAGKVTTTTVESGAFERDKQQPSGILSLLARKPTAVFIYPGQNDLWTNIHETGRIRAQQFLDDRIKTNSVYNVPVDSAYKIMSELAAARCAIIFAAHPSYTDAALKVALENRNSAVFVCGNSGGWSTLNSYNCKLYESMFLLGAAAGSFTRGDLIGYIDLPSHIESGTRSINAFALGARLVNRNINVRRIRLADDASYSDNAAALKRLAASGADVAFCRYPADDPAWPKKYNETLGMLCSLNGRGHIDECLVSLCWNWGSVYSRIFEDYLSGDFAGAAVEGSTTSYLLGLSAAAVQVLRVESAVGTHVTRLIEMMRRAIEFGRLNPLEGPVHDIDGVLRIGRYEIPSPSEMEEMNWLCDIVSEG